MIEKVILPAWKEEKVDENESVFVLEPLEPGFGPTIGNPLRRVLLSSLAGAAITAVRFKGATHEFSALPGVREDLVEVILNLKRVRLSLIGEDPVWLDLEKKGGGEVKAKDFEKNAAVAVSNPDQTVAHVNSGLDLSVRVEAGRGYRPAGEQPSQADFGTIEIDGIFSPVLAVNYEIENTRVEQRTDFDKLILKIKTDGSLTPKEALSQAAEILVNHFQLFIAEAEEKPAKPAKKTEVKTSKSDSKKAES